MRQREFQNSSGVAHHLRIGTSRGQQKKASRERVSGGVIVPRVLRPSLVSTTFDSFDGGTSVGLTLLYSEEFWDRYSFGASVASEEFWDRYSFGASVASEEFWDRYSFVTSLIVLDEINEVHP